MGQSRNRIIYQSEALAVGPTPSTGSHFDAGQSTYPLGNNILQYNSGNSLITGLNRIQDISYGFNIPRKDVNQFGELARIDAVILESPTVNFSTKWLVANLFNERMLGFTISSGTPVSCVSGFITKVSDDKNYFIRSFREGQDAQNNPDESSNVYTLALGNGFINNYSVQGSVGNFIEASLSAEALNFKVDAPSGSIPAVSLANGSPILNCNYDINNFTSNPTGSPGLTVSVLRPGDVTISLGTYGTAANGEPSPSITDWKVQSFQVGVGLNRTPLVKLGSKFAFSREINFPLSATASFTANVGDMVTGNLADFIGVDTNYNLQISVAYPGQAAANQAITYRLQGCKLESQSYTSSIGASKSVTLSFSTQIGSATQTGVGLFLSGAN